MRIVLMEPLGVDKEKIQQLARPLMDQGHELVAYDSREEDEDKLIDRVKDADVLMLANQPLSSRVIEAAEHLKMISVAFTGVDHVAIKTCQQRGIRVCNAAGYSTHSVAELAFGLMIAVYRKIVPCDAAVRGGKTRQGLIGNDLYGKTLGIVGTGAIGLRVAEIGKAFGCSLLAYSRTHKPEAEQLGVRYVELNELLSQSDIVTLHTPLSEATRGLIGKEQLELMKSTSILINTARGPVVDSAALAAALKEGGIAGAGIDVFETEPPISGEHPLLNSPNTVVAPHVAFATHEALYRRAQITFMNIQGWMKGELQNVIV